MRRRERRLRETVEQRQGCLDELPARQERVLRLRAGVGPAQPLTRAGVARRLDITVRRVARLERAGLRRLRGLCTPAIASAPVAQPGTRAVFTGSGADGIGGGEFDRPASDSGAGSTGQDDGGGNSAGGGSAGSGVPEDEGDGATGGTGTGSGDRGGVAGAIQTHVPGSDDGRISLLIPLILLLMAFAAWAIVVARRRRDEPAPAGPAPPPPAPWRPRVPPSSMTGPGWTERPTSRGESGRWSAPPAPERPAEPATPEPPGEAAPDESWVAPRRSPTSRR